MEILPRFDPIMTMDFSGDLTPTARMRHCNHVDIARRGDAASFVLGIELVYRC